MRREGGRRGGGCWGGEGGWRGANGVWGLHHCWFDISDARPSPELYTHGLRPSMARHGTRSTPSFPSLSPHPPEPRPFPKSPLPRTLPHAHLPPLLLAPSRLNLTRLSHALNSLAQIIRDPSPNNTIPRVLRVSGDVVAHPAGAGPGGAVCAAAHEVEVAGEGAARLDVDVDAVEVGFYEGEEAGEGGWGGRRRGRRVGLAVDNLGGGHEGVFVLDWGQGRGGGGGGGGAGTVGRGRVWPAGRGARAKGVLSEPEAVLAHGVAAVRRLHVLRRAGNGYVEVQVEAEDRARGENDEDGKGGILEIRHLDLHAAKLDAPASLAARGRGLEAHVLPVCALQVLKMVGAGEVEVGQVFVEDDNGVADEEVGKVCREEVVHAARY